MKYVKYKGSLYTKASERIKTLAALNRPYSITTTEEQLEIDNFLYWKVKAEIILLDTHEVFSGIAMRRYEKDHPFGSYPLEWAETVATARAIGKMGIGIDYSYACLEELGSLVLTDVREREPQAVAVEAITTEDMKAQLGGMEIAAEPAPEPEPEPEPKPEPEPVDEPFSDIELGLDTPPEPEKPKSRADVLAEQLRAKKEEAARKMEERKKKKKPVRPQPPDKISLPPDKVDKLFDAIDQLSDEPPEDDIPWAVQKEDPDEVETIDV